MPTAFKKALHISNAIIASLYEVILGIGGDSLRLLSSASSAMKMLSQSCLVHLMTLKHHNHFHLFLQGQIIRVLCGGRHLADWDGGGALVLPVDLLPK